MIRAQIAIILIASLSLGGCGKSRSGAPVEKQSLQVRQHCVGRNVMSVPEQFSVSSIATGQFRTAAMGEKGPMIEVTVRADRVTRNHFGREVDQVRAELQQRTSGDIDVIRLEKELEGQSTLFRVQQVDDAYKSEIVFLKNGNVIQASLESFQNGYEAAEAHLINFVTSLLPADPDPKISGTQGFCLGPVVITGELKKETGSFSFSDKRGVTLELDLDTYAKDAKAPLLARASGPDSLLAKFDIKPTVLRSGERVVAGMKAQEWLGRIRTGEIQDTYSFAIETMREVPGRGAPKLHLSLSTADQQPGGERSGKLLSDDQAMQLWDLIVNSIESLGG
jgi:hypothetical protein